MPNHTRAADGLYHISGKTYKHLCGSRVQVHHQTAYQTQGGLTKSDLLLNKWGRIVSAKKHRTAKRQKRLQKLGFFATKGKFGVEKRSLKKRMRGGNLAALSPATYGSSAPTAVETKANVDTKIEVKAL
jgi:hypothetical protein